LMNLFRNQKTTLLSSTHYQLQNIENFRMIYRSAVKTEPSLNY